jgi:hypothetical protein
MNKAVPGRLFYWFTGFIFVVLLLLAPDLLFLSEHLAPSKAFALGGYANPGCFAV